MKTERRSTLRNWLCFVSIVWACTSFVGCSLCCSPYDYDYGTFGTRTPRSDMRNGRVGSIFSDPALVGQRGTPSNASVEYADEGASYMYDSAEPEVIAGELYESE